MAAITDPARASPLLIGASARIYHPGADGIAAAGVWTKTLHDLEQNVAHWRLAGGAMAVMAVMAVRVPAVEAAGTVLRSDLDLRDDARALDGLVLQGGNDVAPQSYGELPQHADWHGDAVRDRYEGDLIRAFVAAGKPVFGICRGLQRLNVCFGGTLWQDIPTQQPGAMPHRVPGRYEHHHHGVTFVPGSRLAQLLGGRAGAAVNSIHHQAIKTLAPGLVAEAHGAEDGLIEAVHGRGRGRGPGWVAGVQWHPECHGPAHPHLLDDTPLLHDFLAAAQAVRAAR